MKNVFLLFLSIILLTACNEDSKVVEDTPKIPDTYISGQLENPLSEMLLVTKGAQVMGQIQVNEDGTFSDTLQLQNAYYRLRHNKSIFYVYLEPGDNLKITADMEAYPESLSFSGDGVENNNYLNKKRAKIGDITLPPNELYALEEADFLAKADEIDREAKAAFESFTLSPEFMKLEQQSIDYQNLARLKNYPSYHAYFAKKEGFKPESEVFTEPFEGFDFDNEANYQTFPAYNSIVNTHYEDMYEQEEVGQFMSVIKDIKSKSIQNDLLETLSYYVSPGNGKSEEIYQAVMSISSDEELKEQLTKKYELLKSLEKGKPSPKFIYQDINGRNVALDELKGKNVYIDVWATWCGPCKKEIPDLKEIEQAHRGKNIEFVGLSIDKQKDIEKWQEMVKEKEMKGIHVIADKANESEFVKAYAIEGIPRYILLDTEGNIVSADAPRPSEKEKLLALFEEAGVK